MTLQNRVGPDGEIVADPARGLFLGNRGILHDDRRQLGPARWRHRNWVCCTLSFKERRRVPMTPGTYTELFFLDEAVALAAGHRPCAECRRADYQRFRDHWEEATGLRPTPAEMDGALHAARALRGGRRLATWEAEADDLPDGTFIAGAALILGDRALPFGFAGYGPARPRPRGRVTVLTPEPTVQVLGAGYRPVLHPSAQGTATT